ncbi:hypothetical protein J6P92_05885 [bacterium]|nr:hypothetical protein [bacterium]
MKKFITLILLISMFVVNSSVYAIDDLDFENSAPIPSERKIKEQQEELVVHDDAPIWAEYVAPKYRNPRSDFKKGSSIAELVVGVILTDLILTAPIGIPMTIHGTTKVKMVSYNNRKNIFDEEIAKAKLIQDDTERAAAYQKILKQCHLKESTRQHYAKKEAKAKKKAAKKAKNLDN